MGSPLRVRARPEGRATLVCDGVTHVYGREGRGGWFGDPRDGTTVTALSDVSVRFDPGELTAIAGASGSGKSTLLHLLSALEPPTEGRVTIDETDTGALDQRERTRFRLNRVGIVFQRFHLLSALSARSNVALPLLERGASRASSYDRAERLLEQVGLGDRTAHRPGELSGGEQQRVAVARALSTDPDVLVADEPTGELDSETGDQVMSLIEDLVEERTVVVASHDPRVVERADRVVQLRDGEVMHANRP